MIGLNSATITKVRPMHKFSIIRFRPTWAETKVKLRTEKMIYSCKVHLDIKKLPSNIIQVQRNASSIAQDVRIGGGTCLP